MEDLLQSRQCDEFDTDTAYQLYRENQLEAYEEHQFQQLQVLKLTSSDAQKINDGLQIQSILRRLENRELNEFTRQILIKCLGKLLIKDFTERQKSWSNQDREKWYELQDQQYEPVISNPF